MIEINEYINTKVYEELGRRWHEANDDPIALLRAESRLRNPWIMAHIRPKFNHPVVLDVGCGGGFLSNDLAKSGFRVVGLDSSKESLKIARDFDATKSVRYEWGDALSLPFAAKTFDVVCAMDFLEHVADPKRVIREVSRVLKPGGLFFFHTFNRNILAGLIIIKGVEWFVKNTPKHLHRYRYFIKPKELLDWCVRDSMNLVEIRGCRPAVNSDFFTLLRTRIVPEKFQFKWTPSLAIAYAGVVEKSLLD